MRLERVFVADSKNHRVSVHRLDGTFVRAFGGRGAGNGQFAFPRGLAVDGGRVLVADQDNHRVQVLR